MTVLQGRLADRDGWSAVGECPIEKTMTAVGQKSAMLLMREAYYGTTRFDDFSRRAGITKATLLMGFHPTSQEGRGKDLSCGIWLISREREYRLTEREREYSLLRGSRGQTRRNCGHRCLKAAISRKFQLICL